MNKTKTTVAITGGASVLLVLLAAGFVWISYSTKTVAIEGDYEEGTDGYETVLLKAEQLSRRSVYPCKESIETIEANIEKLDSWKAEALALAARGDWSPDPTESAPQLKARLRDEAGQLMKLPGSVGGVLVKPDFAFGAAFKDYITGGKMPAEADIPALQRNWYDISMIVTLLSQSGITELTDVAVKTAANEPETNAKPQRTAKSRKPAAEPPSSAVTYSFSFSTRPAGFVKAINALTTANRFIVIDDFTIQRQGDPIREALGGEDDKRADQGLSRRARGRRRGSEPEQEEGAVTGGIVTDPQAGAPFNVVLTVTTHDFKSKQTKEEAK